MEIIQRHNIYLSSTNICFHNTQVNVNIRVHSMGNPEDCAIFLTSHTGVYDSDVWTEGQF